MVAREPPRSGRFRERPGLWKRAIVHVDLDAFFASVELKDNPRLAGLPVVVGAPQSERGVVAAASYEARRFGVHSAMPMARAVRLCPKLVIIPPRFERYEEESHALREIFTSFTPLVEPLSLDEAFLDVTGSQRLYGPAPEIGRSLQERILRERALSASVGVASSKFVAKVASDLRKPAGFVVVEPGGEEEFLRPLPIGRMWGVGPVTERRLLGLGIHTIGELARQSAETLRPTLGSLAERLIQLAHGQDDSPVEPASEAKSLSAENTFAQDLAEATEMERELLVLAERVGERLRAEGLAGRTITLKVRFADFHTITRSTSLQEPTHSTEEIYKIARTLLREQVNRKGRKVRLLGIATSHLSGQAVQQLDLFTSTSKAKTDRLEHTLDELRGRLGADILRRGELLTPTEKSKRSVN